MREYEQPKKKKRPKNPDYYCHYKDGVTAQWLNRNIKSYEIRIDGKYVCTAHVQENEGRQEAIKRFKVLKPGYRDFPDDKIETILTAVVQ